MSKTRISRFVALGDSLSDRGTMNNRYLMGFLPMSSLSGLSGTSPRGRFTNGYTWLDCFIANIATKLSIQTARDDKRSAEQKKIDDVKGRMNLDKVADGIPESPDDILNQHQEQPIVSATETLDIVEDTEEVTEEKMSEEKMSNDDIADAAIAHAKNVDTLLKHGYVLKHDNFVTYRGYNWVNCYAEGGLTARDYSWNPISNIPKFFSRAILSTLAKVRGHLLADDKKADRTPEEKKETLIMELSGANDLITVNKEPTKEAAKKAIFERIRNIEILIQNGYQNFVLLGLPDLSLTPRYQRKTPEEQAKAAECSEYFNEKLKKKCAALAAKHEQCNIKFFDMNETFRKIYNDPKTYGFKEDKLTEPYIESDDFTIDKEKETSPGQGYMFYDDVHPTAGVHAILGDIFSKKYSEEFDFGWAINESKLVFKKEEVLVAEFRNAYNKQLDGDRNRIFGRFVSSRINPEPKTTTLKDILKHALVDGGERSRKVLQDLGWIDKQGLLKAKEICLARAMGELQANLAEENATATASKKQRVI